MTECQTCNNTRRSCNNRKLHVGKGPHIRNDSQGGKVERQSRLTATAKAIEDLEDREMTSERKLPKEAARRRRQTTKRAGKRPKGKT